MAPFTLGLILGGIWRRPAPTQNRYRMGRLVLLTVWIVMLLI
jgi:hypothetical protein